MKRCVLISALFVTGMLCSSSGAFDFPVVQGWERSPETERYLPDNLYEYIDGAAEAYLSFGFKELETAEYIAGKSSVLVEVYRHATPEDAFGIYARERPREGPFESVGYQGYRSGEIFCLVASDYYIKILGNRLGGNEPVILENFARKIADQIPDADAAPRLLQVFPRDSLIRNSEAYTAQDFLGYAFLKNVFTADYPGFRLFVISAGSPAGVHEILAAYTEKLDARTPYTAGGATEFSDPHHGRILFCWDGDFIWGAFEIDRGPVKSYVERLGDRIRSGKF
jgi:hypothetical protein